MLVGLNGQEMACLHREHKLIIALQPTVIKHLLNKTGFYC